MDEQLFEIAGSGSPVLTANKRLARQLVQQFDRKHQDAGLRAWRRPVIMPASVWLQEQLRRLGMDTGLLSDIQEQHIWETLISADLDAWQQQRVQVPATARKAREAHRLLRQFDASFQPGEGAGDHRAFLKWRTAWQQQLDEGGHLDRAETPWLVAEAFQEGRLPRPQQIVLAGFDELTPDLTHLTTTLRRLQCQVEEWNTPACSEVQRRLIPCADSRDEVSRCARWVRQQLLEGPVRIGVVVPDLASYRSLIEATFLAELDPQAYIAVDTERPELFSVSLGCPLADEGLVHAALFLLGLSPVVTFDEISWLLRSPHFAGGEKEMAQRAAAERVLRECGAATWTLGRLVKRFAKVPGLDRLVALLDDLRTFVQQNRMGRAGEWADRFARLLEKCGWPGQRSLTSREYQAVEHFKELLLRLSSLDLVGAPMSRSAAVGTLKRLSVDMVFQPETPDAQIQVLGLLETAGLDFDCLWLMGMHDRALPGLPAPNPFIPLPLQKRLAMPHADAERERQFTEIVGRRLFSASPMVIASYPSQVEGANCLPSPSLDGFTVSELTLPETVHPARIIHGAAPRMELLDDSRTTPLVSKKPFSGGTGLLKDQALCPFRAFAHHRLKARGLDIPDLGINRMDRGSLVHTALELFWKDVMTQTALAALTEDEIDQRLARYAEQALSRQEKGRRLDFPPVVRRLEHTRLRKLCREWLDVEQKRPGFSVEKIEALHAEQVGRLTIRTKVDRIDRLDSGRLAIIDYKTGRPVPANWLGERITEPQLPVYCLSLQEESLEVVAFASIKPQNCRFLGLSRAADALPGLSAGAQERLLCETGLSSFSDVLRHWQKALPALGDAFADGVAAVDPVDREQACQTCDLVSLCRILEGDAVLINQAEVD